MENKTDSLGKIREEKISVAFDEGCRDFTETKLTEVLDSEQIAVEKAERYLGGMKDDFRELWQLLRNYRAGLCPDVPWKVIAAAGFAMLYLLNPFDVISDFLPLVGYLDDVFIFALAASLIRKQNNIKT